MINQVLIEILFMPDMSTSVLIMDIFNEEAKAVAFYDSTLNSEVATCTSTS